MDTITSEQNALVERIAEETLSRCLGGHGDEVADEEVLRALFERLYREALDAAIPDGGLQVFICDGPESAARKARELCDGADCRSVHCVGLAYTARWAETYRVFRDSSFADVLPDDAEESKLLDLVLAILHSGVWESYALDGGVVISRPPMRRAAEDEEGRYHSDDEPAIVWRDGTRLFYWHGLVVPDDLWLHPETVTAERWASATTEEIRAVAERLGWQRYLDLRHATLRDAWEDPTTGLRYELYDGGQYGLLRKQSPVLQDGSQPWYCEPVPPACRTAAGARRWQVPTADGSVLSPEEAEAEAAGLHFEVEA